MNFEPEFYPARILNADLLDKSVGDYKINSKFETASGTTNVEIQNRNSIPYF